MSHSSYTSREVKEYSNQITETLAEAGLDPAALQEFLESQIEVCWNINRFLNDGKTENLSEEEYFQLHMGSYLQNEILLTKVSIFSDLIDVESDTDSWFDKELLWESVKLHSLRIRQVLLEARLDIDAIHTFLKQQIEVFSEITIYNRDKIIMQEKF